MAPAERDSESTTDNLIYDWNNVGRRYAPFGAVEFLDETLRDGIQNPSVKGPVDRRQARDLASDG